MAAAHSAASKVIAVSLAANPGTLSGSSSVCTGSGVTFTRSGGVSGGTWSSSNTSSSYGISFRRCNRCRRRNGSDLLFSNQHLWNKQRYKINYGDRSTPTLTATNITASTDFNACSALVTLGSNVTVTGSATLQYRIGIFPIFSFPISSTHTFFRGTTPVTVIATNSCGSTARIFLVTVNDNQAPAITCKPNATKSC